MTTDQKTIRGYAIGGGIGVGSLIIMGMSFMLGIEYEQHRVARHWYVQCRESLGLAPGLTTLRKDQWSACHNMMVEQIGIEDRWPDELP